MLEACRASRRLARYQRLRLSNCGRVRGAGFAFVATFEHPHFTLVLPDTSEFTLARLERCFRVTDPESGSVVERVAWKWRIVMDHDIVIDFMDMRDDGRVWARLADTRPGLVPIARRRRVPSRPAYARLSNLTCTDDLRIRRIAQVDGPRLAGARRQRDHVRT